MRIPVVTLGLVVLISTVSAAQISPQRHTFVPAHKSRLSIDFGMKQALKSLPQRPVECDKVKKHRHELLPLAAPAVKPLSHAQHHLTTLPAAPCAVR